MPKQPNYSQYVDHPRYGKSPRYTDLDADRNNWDVRIHWNTRIVSDAVLAKLRETCGDWPPPWLTDEEPLPIPGTAVEADSSRQVPRPVPVTHYYDLDVRCRQCKRRFIFFAEEQKFWYEELQLPLEAQAVRCCECREQERWLANQKKRYDALFHTADRTVEQDLEMADHCLTLIEQAVFHPKQAQHVRQLLNAISEECRQAPRYLELRIRLQTYESNRPEQPLES